MAKCPKDFFINEKTFGGVAQLGEHLLCKQGVASSNLVASTKTFINESFGGSQINVIWLLLIQNNVFWNLHKQFLEYKA